MKRNSVLFRRNRGLRLGGDRRGEASAEGAAGNTSETIGERSAGRWHHDFVSELLNTADVANLLDVSPQRVRTLARDSVLPAIRAEGGAGWLFRASDVREYQERRTGRRVARVPQQGQGRPETAARAPRGAAPRPGGDEGLRGEVERLRAENERLRAEVDDLVAEVGGLRADNERLRAEVDDVRAQGEELVASLQRSRALSEVLVRELG